MTRISLLTLPPGAQGNYYTHFPAVVLPVFLVQQSLHTLNANGIIEMQSMPALCWVPSLHAVSEYKAQRCMHTL